MSTRPSLRVDRRIGSVELAAPLRRLGAPVEIVTLPFADAAFVGHGPTGEARIGVERKKVTELLGALSNPRFIGRQVPGLLRSYDVVWLLVEGPARCGREGELLLYNRPAGYGRQTHSYLDFERFLLTLQQKAGLHIMRTDGMAETVHWLYALHGWWQKPWAKHQSAYEVGITTPDAALLTPQTVLRKVAAQLPGIGWTRSASVEQAFPDVRAMATAPRRAWEAIEGIGPTTARRVIRALRGRTP